MPPNEPALEGLEEVLPQMRGESLSCLAVGRNPELPGCLPEKEKLDGRPDSLPDGA